MESPLGWEHKDLVNELSQGKELARQLQIHLNFASSPQEARELLAHKILNSYEKALAILKWNGPLAVLDQQPNTVAKISYSDSDHDLQVKTESKKRKSMPRWTQQVQVRHGTVIGQVEDGYSWRKYGQKDILGAKHPRGYYRCTRRHVQGCLATKQVQRSDEDTNIFEINYRGSHTCFNAPRQTLHQNTEPNTKIQSQQQMTQPQQNQNLNKSQETLLSFKAGPTVITEDLHTDNKFTSMENQFISTHKEENKFYEDYFSPSFTSPATSASSYYSISPSQVAGFGEASNLNGLESEFLGYMSMPTSADNSPSAGFEYPFGPMDQFEPSFCFDGPIYFSNC